MRQSLLLVIHRDVRYDHRQRIKPRNPRMNAWVSDFVAGLEQGFGNISGQADPLSKHLDVWCSLRENVSNSLEDACGGSL